MGWIFANGLIFKYSPSLGSHDDMSLMIRKWLWSCCHIWKKVRREMLVLYWTSYCAWLWEWLHWTYSPWFVQPLCVKSQHWWSCFGRIVESFWVFVFFFHCDVLTVNKVTVLAITLLLLTAPFFKDIFWDITSSCLLWFELTFKRCLLLCEFSFVIKYFRTYTNKGFTYFFLLNFLFWEIYFTDKQNNTSARTCE